MIRLSRWALCSSEAMHRAKAREIHLTKNTHFVDFHDLLGGLTDASTWAEVSRCAAIAASMREVDTVFAHVFHRFNLGSVPPQADTATWVGLIHASTFCDIERRSLGSVVPLSQRVPCHDGSVTLRILDTMRSHGAPFTPEVALKALEVVAQQTTYQVALRVLDICMEAGGLTPAVLDAFVETFIPKHGAQCAAALITFLQRLPEGTMVLVTAAKALAHAAAVASGTSRLSDVSLTVLFPPLTQSEDHKVEASCDMLRILAAERHAQTPDYFGQFAEYRTVRHWAVFVGYFLHAADGGVARAVEELRAMAMHFGKALPEQSQADKDAFTAVHESVLTALCGDGSSPEDVTLAYHVFFVNRSFGLTVTTSMCNTLLRVMCERGDARVFGIVDVTVTASHCNVDVATLEYLFRTCQVAKDFHRAQALHGTLCAASPGLEHRLTTKTKTILEEMGIARFQVPHLLMPGVAPQDVPRA